MHAVVCVCVCMRCAYVRVCHAHVQVRMYVYEGSAISHGPSPLIEARCLNLVLLLRLSKRKEINKKNLKNIRKKKEHRNEVFSGPNTQKQNKTHEVLACESSLSCSMFREKD